MFDQHSRHTRRTLRLCDYDYSRSGAYFITICVQDRLCLFGDVVEENVQLNASGEMVLHWWLELPRKYTHGLVDDVIVMPNHLRGVILINDYSTEPDPPQAEASLGAIVGWFKTMTTNAYIRQVRESAWQPFHLRLWQRNYFEHIIRSERAHHRLRTYIATNPARRSFDQEHPLHQRTR